MLLPEIALPITLGLVLIGLSSGGSGISIGPFRAVRRDYSSYIGRYYRFWGKAIGAAFVFAGIVMLVVHVFSAFGH